MKLVRYGCAGEEKPGVVDERGEVRDLSSLVEDFGPATLSPQALQALRAIQVEQLPQVSGRPRLGPPLPSVGKFVAIGLNYKDHAQEAKMALPSEPVVFMKAPTCLTGPYDDVVQPKRSTKLDWEAELGIVIGSEARSVSVGEALDHVAGYCVVNDVSERHFQLERGGTWDKGKGFDTFGPIGPYLVTRDEVGDVQQLGIWLDLNGERMQTGNTRDMIFDCATIVSYVSECMTMLPGDIITTGTPPGVGMGLNPPRYLKPGDVMTLGVDKLGVQKQRVVPFTSKG